MIPDWAKPQPYVTYAKNAGPWKSGGSIVTPPRNAAEWLDRLAALPPGADPDVAQEFADQAYRAGASIDDCVTVLDRWRNA